MAGPSEPLLAGGRRFEGGGVADLSHQLLDGRGDPVLDVARPAEGRAAVLVEVRPALVAPFLPDAPRGDVGDHVVRVAADPGAGAELALEPQRVIHDRLRPHADDQHLLAQPPGVQRIRIRRRELLARVELLQHPLGPAGADGVRVPAAAVSSSRVTTFRYGRSTYSNAVRSAGETGFSGCFSASSTRVGQHVAVLLAQLDPPPRQRVLVAAAGVDEHGRRARVALLQRELGEARVVAAPLGEAERRRVAGVAEEDRREAPVRPRHGHHRHRVIDRPGQRLALGQQGRDVGLAVVAAVDGEGRLALADLQGRGGELRERLADQLDEPSRPSAPCTRRPA